MDGRKIHTGKYLFWAFILAWPLQIAGSLAALKGNSGTFTLLLAVSMFAPLAAAALSRSGAGAVGWKPRLRGHWRSVFAAWFLPALLGIAGAALYFVLWPESFDRELSSVTASLGEAGIVSLAEQGLSVPTYAAAAIASSITAAPFINMLAAVGEEAGWRGVLYPALKQKYGAKKGRLLGGVIWGVWHWPVMILAGYEYGMSYWGAPFLGPPLFCIFTIALGIFLDVLYEESGCIWVPALAHGAVNAFAGVPSLFLTSAYADRLILGPLMVGLIGGLPMILTAAFLLFRRHPEKKEP